MERPPLLGEFFEFAKPFEWISILAQYGRVLCIRGQRRKRGKRSPNKFPENGKQKAVKKRPREKARGLTNEHTIRVATHGKRERGIAEWGKSRNGE